MRKFVYVEPGDDGITPVEIIKTEKEILEEYYPFWKTAVTRACGQEFYNQIKDPVEECITDWIIVNWAEEIH